MKGIVKGFYKPTGQIITSDKVYNFTVDCVSGSIENNQEVDFTIDESGLVTRVDGMGAETVHEEPIQEELLLEQEEE